MSRTIDVTGLNDEAVHLLEQMVEQFRGNPLRHYGPPPGDTAEAWIARWQAFVDSRPPVKGFADDSRENIYAHEGR